MKVEPTTEELIAMLYERCPEFFNRPQPAQEPVAWITPDGEGFRIRFSAPTNDVPLGWDALYTTPQQRPWVGLTDEDIRPMCAQTWVFDTVKQWAEVIEAKLKEKNT